MRMQKSTRILLSNITSASILVLAACQPSGINAPQTIQVKQVSQKLTPNPVVKKPQLKSNVSDRPVFGEAVVDGKKKEIKLTIQYPEPEGFKTQALGCNPFDSFEIKVQGIGIATPIYADGADATTNRINATPGNCQFTANLSNVPIGNGRIVSVLAFDSSGTFIQGTELLAAVNITDGVSSNAELSYKTYPTGLVLSEMMGQGSAALTPHPHTASKVDIAALQTLVDGIMAVTGSFPAYGYPSAHPYLVNAVAIANDLIASNGDVSSLNASNPAYVLAGQSISVDVSGASGGNNIDVIVRDPISGASAGNTFVGPTDTITLNGIPPGNWLVSVVNTTTSVTKHVNATAGGANAVVNFAGSNTWNPTNGPVSIHVNTVFHAGGQCGSAGVSEVYVGTKSGIYRTADITNLGANPWTPWNSGLTDLDVTAIACNPTDVDDIYVGTAFGGVWRTSDFGVQAFVDISDNLPGDAQQVTQIYMDTSGPTAVYIASEDGFWGIPVADIAPGPPNWANQNGPPPATGPIPNAPARNKARFSVEPGGTYFGMTADAAAGVYESPGGGPTWTDRTTGVGISTPDLRSILAITPSEAYVGTALGAIQKWNGSVWSGVGTGIPSEEVSTLTVNGTDYFAGTLGGGGVYHHSGAPSGGSWSQLGTGLENEFVKDIEISTAIQIYAATKGGIFSHSGTVSTNWVDRNTADFRSGSIGDLHLDRNDATHNTLYATVGDDGLHKTTDGGDTWFRLDRGGGLPIFTQSVASDPASSTVYVGTPAIGVWRSSSGGNGNWVQLNSGPFGGGTTAEELHVEDQSGTSYVYAATGSAGLMKAEVGNESNSATIQAGNIFSIAVDPNNPAIVYAGTDNGSVYKSINATNALGSITFNPVDVNGPAGGNVNKIVVHPLNSNVIYAVLNTTFASGTPIYKSVDGGATWNPAVGNLQADASANPADVVNSFAVDQNDLNTVYVGLVAGPASKFMKNTTGGTGTWTDLSTGLFTYPTVLVPRPAPATQMFIGTFKSSVWQRSL